MTIELPKELVEKNVINPYSAAYITYLFHSNPEMIAVRDKYLENRVESSDELEQRSIILNLKDPKDFFKWMRKPLAGKNKFLLREVMLKHEDDITEMLKTKILTSFVDDFIECTTEFFIECKENHCDWIIKNFDNIANPYAQSELCLVFGYRGDKSYVNFLLDKAQDFSSKYDDENFKQGPIIALYKLAGLLD